VSNELTNNQEEKSLTANVTVVHSGGWQSTVEAEDTKTREAIIIVLRKLKETFGDEYSNFDFGVQPCGRTNSGKMGVAVGMNPRTPSAEERLKSVSARIRTLLDGTYNQ